MPKGPRGEKRPADAISRAVLIGKIATGEVEDTVSMSSGGSQSAGGKARSKSLTASERHEIAKKAAKARWDSD